MLLMNLVGSFYVGVKLLVFVIIRFLILIFFDMIFYLMVIYIYIFNELIY